MRKTLLIAILLIFPSLSYAWETSIGVGYYGQRFNELDDLGAYQNKRRVNPDHTQAAALNAAFLLDIGQHYRIGLDTLASYGSLSFQKTTLNINNFQTWNYIVGGSFQVHDDDFIMAFKPGFLICGLNTEYKHILDIDTGASLALRISVPIFNSQRIFFEPQAILTSSIHGNTHVVTGGSMVIGIEQVFQSIKSEPTIIDQPKEITPVSIAPLPVETTVSTAEVEKPKNLVLKFDGNNLDPESMWFLKKVLEVYKKAPSVINIYHKNTKDAEDKSLALSKWLLEHNVPQEDLVIKGDLKNKEIKIEVNKK